MSCGPGESRIMTTEQAKLCKGNDRPCLCKNRRVMCVAAFNISIASWDHEALVGPGKI